MKSRSKPLERTREFQKKEQSALNRLEICEKRLQQLKKKKQTDRKELENASAGDMATWRTFVAFSVAGSESGRC